MCPYVCPYMWAGEYIAATAVKLIVLDTDADNHNAVVNEVAVWAV